MRLIITGTPGTGKSTIGKALAKRLGCDFIPIKRVVLQNGLRERGGDVDIPRLRKALIPLLRSEDFIVEGHLACEMELPADLVVIMRCEPHTLETRLRKRGYGKRKAGENVMCELLDYCTQRVDANYGKKGWRLELDTSRRSIKKSVSLLETAIRGRKRRIDSVKYVLADYIPKGGD